MEQSKRFQRGTSVIIAACLLWAACTKRNVEFRPWSGADQQTFREQVGAYLNDEQSWQPFFHAAPLSADVLSHLFLICGRRCRLLTGENAFDYVFKSGKISLERLESHRDDVLELLSQLETPLDDQLQFKEEKFTPRKLLERSTQNLYKLTERETKEGFQDMELGWTLCAYAHYLAPEQDLITDKGIKTNLTRLLAHSLTNRNLHNFAEAGTHELIGIACALKKLEQDENADSSKGSQAIIAAARLSLREEIREFLNRMTPEGNFQIPFREARYSQLLEGLGGSHSLNAAVSGHILTVLAEALESSEILSDRRIAAAAMSLLSDLRTMEQELLPVYEVNPEMREVSRLGTYQRIAYAHGYQALQLLHEKLSATSAAGRR